MPRLRYCDAALVIILHNPAASAGQWPLAFWATFFSVSAGIVSSTCRNTKRWKPLSLAASLTKSENSSQLSARSLPTDNHDVKGRVHRIEQRLQSVKSLKNLQHLHDFNSFDVEFSRS